MQLENYKELAVNLFFVSGFAILILFLYWNILYVFLKKKYDKLFFKEPYFNKNEIETYSHWPFSLVKATSYILLITNIKTAKKRFNISAPVFYESTIVKFFCYFLIYTTLFFGGIFLTGLIWGAMDMLG